MMLNFQEQHVKDLDVVFFNAGAKEFVTRHKISGVRGGKAATVAECDVIVDYELYKERIYRTDKLENLSLDGLVFFIKKEDWTAHFKLIPKVESTLRFDDKDYFVISVTDNAETLEITLSAPRG